MIGIDTIGKKAASIVSILLLVGMVVTFLDIRHAKASDIDGIHDRMDRRDVFDTEDKIDDVDNAISKLDRIPVLSEVQMSDLSNLMRKKEKLVRRLESYR